MPNDAEIKYWLAREVAERTLALAGSEDVRGIHEAMADRYAALAVVAAYVASGETADAAEQVRIH
jgi:hypothetical protein